MMPPNTDAPSQPSSTVNDQYPCLVRTSSYFSGPLNELLDRSALLLHSNEDLDSLALISKAIHSSPVVTAIRNIHKICSLQDDHILLILKLGNILGEQDAERIVASDVHIYIHTLEILDHQMTCEKINVTAAIVKCARLLHLIFHNTEYLMMYLCLILMLWLVQL